MRRRVRFGFGKNQRLLSQRAFSRVFATGKRYSHPLFLLLVADRDGADDAPPARLGLAVSKKVSRRAVVRNRVKRYIREAFRAQQQEWVGFDLVVVARGASIDATAIDINRALASMAKRHAQRTTTA